MANALILIMTITNKLKPIALGVLVTSFLTVGWQNKTQAVDFNVDNFDEVGLPNDQLGGCQFLGLNQCVYTNVGGSNPNPNTQSGFGAGVIGGSRELEIIDEGGSGSGFGITDGGVLSWSNADGSDSTAKITWNNSGNYLNFDASLFEAISVNVLSVDLNVSLQFDLKSGMESVATSETASVTLGPTTEAVDPGDPAVFFGFPYTAFLANNSNLNFTDIDEIVLTLTGPTAVDMSIDVVEFEVPEPTSILSILGVGFFGVFASRKKKGQKV